MKNLNILTIAFLLFLGYTLNAQVSVTTDGSAADASAMLDVKSSVKGFLAPRLTETEKNNITTPATGLLIYQTNGTAGYYYYNGTAWIQFGLASGASQWSNNGSKIYYNGGNVGIGNADPSFKLDVNGVIHSSVDGGACFQIGNDATLNDFNMANGIGIFGTVDATLGHLKLGNAGPVLSGKTGYLGIGTTNPGSLLTLQGTDENTLINVKSSHATLGPALYLNSTATGGRDWRITSCQTANASGQGSLEVWDATVGAARMVFKPNGAVGIGTTDPQSKLHVVGSIQIQGFDSQIWFGTAGNNSKRGIGGAGGWDANMLYINGWGDWTSGTYVDGNEFYLNCRTWLYNQEDLVFKGYGANADYWFDNYDDVGAADFRAYYGSSLKAYFNNALNGWQTPSDERLKGNIETLSVLDKMDMVRGASYTLNYSGATQIGVIAQEMKAAFPAVVTGDESTGMLGVDYNAVASISLQGVKELNAKVQQLEKEIAELKAIIKANK